MAAPARGAERVASLLLTLDRRTAAAMLKELPERERQAVMRALTSMPDAYLDRQTQLDILKSFRAELRASRGTAPGADHISGLLHDAFGEEAAAATKRMRLRERLARARALLERLDGRSLAFILQGEHPQAIAVVLLELGQAAAGALPLMPAPLQQDLVQRMVTMEGPSIDYVTELLEAAAEKARRLAALGESGSAAEKLKAVAGLLNQFGEEAQQALLQSLEVNHPVQAQQVREQLFTFDDLMRLGPREIQRVLSGIDTKVLAMALKGASAEMEQFLTGNISKRTVERVAEERETMGAVRLSEVRSAQQEMATVARELIQKGEIQYASSGEDQLVS